MNRLRLHVSPVHWSFALPQRIFLVDVKTKLSVEIDVEIVLKTTRF